MEWVSDFARTADGHSWAARGSRAGGLAYAMAHAPLTGHSRAGAAAIVGGAVLHVARSATNRVGEVDDRPARSRHAHPAVDARRRAVASSGAPVRDMPKTRPSPTRSARNSTTPR
jgi:hypothetical protein